ncbi:Small acid-soluble spore protein, H-type [[Clostridium] ultunense Esp]|nr:Small acid-soluble spore protein, H-type [[Clostridium] ultunense Esp]
MDVSRANEILRSPEKIDVFYQGEPVWIDEVDERSKTAKIHKEVQTRPNDKKPFFVSIEHLKESS